MSPAFSGRRRRQSDLAFGFTALISDLDGTLVETEELLWDVYRELLEQRGLDFTTFDYGTIIGRGDEEACAVVLAHFGLPEDPVRWHRDVYAPRVHERLPGVKMRPGADAVLEEARKAGLERGLVTSSPRLHAKVALDAVGLRRHFRVMVTGDMEEVERRKPHPDPYLHAAKLLRVQPHQTLVLEDSPAGVASAKAAGMVVAAFAHKHSPRDGLRQADLVLDDLRDFKLSMLAR